MHKGCVCIVCGWKGVVADCAEEAISEDFGYKYKILLCPECEDGGWIDIYYEEGKED